MKNGILKKCELPEKLKLKFYNKSKFRNFIIFCFFNVSLFNLLIFIPLEAFSADFYLKNGQTIKGKLLKTDEDNYYIELDFGSTIIKKSSVLEIKDDNDLTPVNELKLKVRNAKTKEELISAAEFGFKNNLTYESIKILKIALVKDGNKDVALKEKINVIEENYAREILDKANSHYVSGNFRICVKILNSELLKFQHLAINKNFSELKKNAYANIMSEESSIEYLRNILFVQMTPFQMKVQDKNPTPSPENNKNEFNIDEFTNTEKKMDPALSSIISGIFQLIELKNFIVGNSYDNFNLKPLYSVDEINSVRLNNDRFNEYKKHNDMVYRGRSLCMQFNKSLYALRNKFEDHISNVEKESNIWKNKGYLKQNGEWINVLESKRQIKDMAESPAKKNLNEPSKQTEKVHETVPLQIKNEDLKDSKTDLQDEYSKRNENIINFKKANESPQKHADNQNENNIQTQKNDTNIRQLSLESLKNEIKSKFEQLEKKFIDLTLKYRFQIISFSILFIILVFILFSSKRRK
ncbi:MAG: hypothetical protein ACD_79C00255G0003 [uncultured bacterium]|nr:MAG: hypothetical protein ACD_79C00255G0003 [uncultured bacterium]